MTKRIPAAGLALLLTGYVGSVRQVPEQRPETVLTVLYGQSTSDPGLEDMLTEKLGADFPEVIMEWESVDWGEHFSSELQAKIASGEVPDLIIGKAQDVAGYQHSGYLAPFGSAFAGYIRPEGLSSVTIEGQVYGLPYNALYQGVLYNKNIFWRYGLTPPATLEEMETLVQRLEAAGVVPFATHFRENWYVGNIIMQFAVNQVFSHTPDWGDQFRAGAVSFSTSEDYAACMEQVGALLERSWPDALTVNQSESDKRFAEERAAMYLTGSWSVQAIQAIRPQMQVGIFPYPNGDGTAKLLFEPNITFMKNAQSSQAGLVDEIILSLLGDAELARTVYAFTQTESMLDGVDADSLGLIKPEIEGYKQENRVVDVTVGNSQLVWQFQDNCATQLYNWLEGKADLADVLQYADDNRVESGGFS